MWDFVTTTDLLQADAQKWETADLTIAIMVRDRAITTVDLAITATQDHHITAIVTMEDQTIAMVTTTETALTATITTALTMATHIATTARAAREEP